MFSFKQQVHGEIYEVDHNVLSVLDELEGHPNWYKRTLCEIIATEKVSGIDAGDIVQCSAYFLTKFAQTFPKSFVVSIQCKNTTLHILKIATETSIVMLNHSLRKNSNKRF